MPASMHPVFSHPENKDAKICRYMDFVKYVSMLENGGLYFCRADKLGDSFEGSVPEKNIEGEKQFYSSGQFPGLSSEQLAELLKSQSSTRRRMREQIYLNCWHVSESESAAMCSLYSKSNEAIAIQSSFHSLYVCLDDQYYVGLVRYIDLQDERYSRRQFILALHS